MEIHQGGITYIFYWSGNEPEPKSPRELTGALAFGSMPQALSFVRRFGDTGGFRALLQQRYPGQSYVWKPEDILAKVAEQLIQRRLFVVKRWIPAEGSLGVVGTPAPVVPRRTVQPIAEVREPATFPPTHDDDLQAQVLIAASASGIPFCEECQKRAVA